MPLEARLLDALRVRDWRCATAESVTGGLVAARITDAPGASGAFAGGVVAYSDDAKHDALGVDAALLARHGAVSSEVGRAMALAAQRRFGAQLGVATTGYAGPGGETGLVFVAVATPGGVVVHEMRYAGDRAAVRKAATDDALRFALEALGEPR